MIGACLGDSKQPGAGPFTLGLWQDVKLVNPIFGKGDEADETPRLLRAMDLAFGEHLIAEIGNVLLRSVQPREPGQAIIEGLPMDAGHLQHFFQDQSSNQHTCLELWPSLRRMGITTKGRQKAAHRATMPSFISDHGFPAPGRLMHQRPGAGSAAHIIQRARLLCRRLASGGPGLVLVLGGRKILRFGGAELSASAGQIVLVPDGIDFDVINEPAEDGPYQALALNFATDLVRGHDTDNAIAVRQIRIVRDLPEAFHEACKTAVLAISAGGALPDRVASARVGEILLWLASLGYRFEAPVSSDPITRLRKIMMADPGRDWRAGDIAAMIGASEPSLRRRLATAGTSFTELLVDIRMTAALYLLQSTDKPVTEIALDVGYDSASRFSVRFRARFDFSPSEIRGHRRDYDRNGTKSERRGAAAIAAG
jgi:AraC-like DNA-binding protein